MEDVFIPKPDNINLDGVWRLCVDGRRSDEHIYVRVAPEHDMKAMCNMSDEMEQDYMTAEEWQRVREAVVLDPKP